LTDGIRDCQSDSKAHPIEPAMTEAVASAISGSHYTLMKGMGHFPMIEDYTKFRPYLLDALSHVTS
jgi:pimeloyl-ACP methyl ester carboxylesterase